MSNEDGLPDIGQLPEMGPRQLQAVHRELFGAEHPISNCQHLRRKIAWHVQARREGGLLQSVRALALGIARDATLGARVLENADRRQDAIPVGRAATATVVLPGANTRLPMPGSLLFRKYKGRTLVVKVLPSGFEFEGRRYTSLSAIASEITGTHWNGLAFFRLGKGSRNGR